MTIKRALESRGLTPAILATKRGFRPTRFTMAILAASAALFVATRYTPLLQHVSELLGETASEVAAVLWLPLLGSGLVFMFWDYQLFTPRAPAPAKKK